MLDWLWAVLDRFPPSPELRYHGLALTQERILFEMAEQFETVDSTSWLAFQQFGLESNLYLLKGRTPSFYRRLGAMVFEDISQQKAHRRKPKQGEVLTLFDLEEVI